MLTLGDRAQVRVGDATELSCGLRVTHRILGHVFLLVLDFGQDLSASLVPRRALRVFCTLRLGNPRSGQEGPCASTACGRSSSSGTPRAFARKWRVRPVMKLGVRSRSEIHPGERPARAASSACERPRSSRQAFSRLGGAARRGKTGDEGLLLVLLLFFTSPGYEIQQSDSYWKCRPLFASTRSDQPFQAPPGAVRASRSWRLVLTGLGP